MLYSTTVCPFPCTCSIDHPEDVAAMELQIKEFGQTPKQLFRSPHPQRFDEKGLARQLSLSGKSEEAEEVRTVGVTTQGLGQVESPATPTTPGNRDDGWVHVEVSDQGVIKMTSSSPSPPSTRTLQLRKLLEVHKGPVHAVCLSHDGQCLFSVSHGMLCVYQMT